MQDPAALRCLDRRIRLDTSGSREGYLVIGSHGTPIRLSSSAYHLLKAVRAGTGFEVLAEALSRKQGRKVSADDVESSYGRVVARLAEIDRRVPGDALPPGFWFRLGLLSGESVRRLAAPLAVLFDPRAVVALLAGILAAAVVLLRGGLPEGLGGAAFWPGYGLFLISLIFHELGHAGACVRYGARPNDIGFTIYLIYPAFYSDVTPAWQLDRRQRVVVDLGGAYFQLIVGAAYALGFLLTGWSPFRVGCFLILYSCLFSLNPIFKFDGYWVLADALGVTHLGRQPARIVRYLLDRLRGRSTEPLPWPGWVRAVLAVYTPLSFAVWAWFVWRLMPQLGERAVGYPAQVLAVARDLLVFAAPDWTELQSLLASTFLLLISMLMVWRLAARVAGFGRAAAAHLPGWGYSRKSNPKG
ncbi:MAG: hypothetical protein GY856_32795 [bacterium]|nr:hypothetical protein [bacterium]